MPNDLLATFGDSWAFGAELAESELPFGQIVANNVGKKFINYAKTSTSLDHLILQLNECVNDRPKYNRVTAIFFLTDYSRTLTIQDTEIKPISACEDTFKSYYRDVYSNDLGLFKANVIMLALQHICQQFDIDDYYICGWTPIAFTFPGIDKNKIYNQGLSTCIDILDIPDIERNIPDYFYHENNYYFRPNLCHPNQQGHRAIADALTKWINHEQN